MNILENFVVTYGTGNLSGYRVTYSAYGVIEVCNQGDNRPLIKRFGPNHYQISGPSPSPVGAASASMGLIGISFTNQLMLNNWVNVVTVGILSYITLCSSVAIKDGIPYDLSGETDVIASDKSVLPTIAQMMESSEELPWVGSHRNPIVILPATTHRSMMEWNVSDWRFEGETYRYGKYILCKRVPGCALRYADSVNGLQMIVNSDMVSMAIDYPSAVADEIMLIRHHEDLAKKNVEWMMRTMRRETK